MILTTENNHSIHPKMYSGRLFFLLALLSLMSHLRCEGVYVLNAHTCVFQKQDHPPLPPQRTGCKNWQHPQKVAQER